MRLIDADALVESFRKTKINEIWPNWKELGLVARIAVIRLTIKYRAIILSAPTIEARPVARGEWEDFADKHDKRSSRHDFRCSKCGERASYFVHGSEDWWDGEEPNFCPNCGAWRGVMNDG